MAELTRTVRVTGRVQGVWFRGWTRDEAAHRGLEGWVRNEPDGAVTACLCGPRQAVEDMTDAMLAGPPAARDTDISWQDSTDFDGTGFEIRRG